MRRLLALASALAIVTTPSGARAQEAPEGQSTPTYHEAIVLDVAVGFVPVANDVPLIVGGGVRFGAIHEIFARGGYMPTGDDVGYGFGVLGYRAVFRPGELVRPVVGGYVAALPATCTHDDAGDPTCDPTALFIVSATGGLRLEPVPWLGLFALLSLGVDSYPNPFGMVELGATFALPLS